MVMVILIILLLFGFASGFAFVVVAYEKFKHEYSKTHTQEEVKSLGKKALMVLTVLSLVVIVMLWSLSNPCNNPTGNYSFVPYMLHPECVWR